MAHFWSVLRIYTQPWIKLKPDDFLLFFDFLFGFFLFEMDQLWFQVVYSIFKFDFCMKKYYIMLQTFLKSSKHYSLFLITIQQMKQDSLLKNNHIHFKYHFSVQETEILSIMKLNVSHLQWILECWF